MKREVSASGARVVGDPGLLRGQEAATTTGEAEASTVSMEAAVAGMAALLDALERRRVRRNG